MWNIEIVSRFEVFSVDFSTVFFVYEIGVAKSWLKRYNEEYTTLFWSKKEKE